MAAGLATRCSACGTVFRVVPDQLRVSEGWVRCGRCTQVFNALESLVDLETGLPQREATGLAPLAQPESVDADFEVAQPAARPGAPPLPAPAPDPARAADASSAPFYGNEHGETQPVESSLQATGSDLDGDPLPAPEAADKPSFVRHAERAERWRSPRVRLALVVVALFAVLGLAAQVALEYRDLLAARLPASRALLEQVCTALGCEVGPARAIESLAVESSGLVRVERSSIYRLQVTLRNRAGIELAVPALDVTLTDGQGELIARKVLRLADLGAPQATIAAGRELSVQATLQAAAGADAAPQPIAGYTIELFYP